MYGYLYSRIQTNDFAKGQFIVDIPVWDGRQPQIEDPENPGEYIDDPTVGVTETPPVPGCYMHVYDPVTDAWGEGCAQAELDIIRAEKESQAALARLDEIDRESIRPLRAVAAGTPAQSDIDKLSALEVEAEQLRPKVLL